MKLRVCVALLCVLAASSCVSEDSTDTVEQPLLSDLTITPGAADFGAVVAGDTSNVITFTVTNQGTVKTGPLTRTLSGPDASEFKLTAGCGNRLAAGASCTFGVKFKPTSPGVATASVRISGSPGGDVTASLTGTGLAPAAFAISPTAYDFGATLVGSTSTPASFTVTNIGGSTTGVPTVTVPNAYTIVGNTCVMPLAAGATCVVTTTFTPNGGGNHNGNLRVKANPGGTVTSAISGRGLAPGGIAITPSAFDFGAVAIGASTSGTFTVRNTGTGSIGVPSLVLDGANVTAFSILASTCTAPLAPNAVCTISVRFAPATAGAQSATLAVSATQGGNAVASLGGTGVAPATLAINPASVDFGTVVVGNASTSMAFTVSNTGGATSGVPVVVITGGQPTTFAIVANTCVAPLAAGATCTVVARFAPTSAGAMTATLGVSAPPGGAVAAALAGTGVATSELAITPASRDFGAVVVGTTSPAAVFTVTNVGGATTGVLDTTLTGGDAPAFGFTSNCAGIVLAPGASCQVSLQFSPATGGAKSASLAVSASPGGSVIAALVGVGVAPATLAISPSVRDFGSVLVGTSSAPSVFTITNTGGQTSGEITASLSDSEFAIVANSCSGVTLPSFASCTIITQFAPTAAGAHSATLTMTGTPGGTVAASLAGTGVSPGALAISPSLADFGAVSVGQTSSAVTFVVSNVGGATTGPLDVTITGSDSSQFALTASNCSGVVLAAGASCTIDARLAPTSAGPKMASLSVSSTPGGTVTASISGTGIAPGALAINPAIVDYGTVVVGATSSAFAFTVSNTGGATTGIPDVALVGTDPASFIILANTCTAPLSAGATCTITARFAPFAAGNRSAALQVSATPGGTVAAALVGTAVAPSALVITPSSFDFGAVVVGSTSGTGVFTVLNTGGDTSSLPSITVDGPGGGAFVVISSTCTVALAPGQSCTIAVRFSPTSGGVSSATLSVSTSGENVAASLTGTGIAPAQLSISPSLADLGSVAVGTSSSPLTFTVANNGGSATGVLDVALDGSDPSHFAILANSCAGFSLAPFQTCTVLVRFSPSSAGALSASLSVSATPGGAVAAALSGNAI